MIGNVAEIVNHDLSGKPKRALWIYLGGAWNTQVGDVSKSITDMSWGASHSGEIGFRCARRAGEKPDGWVIAGGPPNE